MLATYVSRHGDTTPMAVMELPRYDAARMAHEAILEQLRRPIDVETYHEIRELWKKHSIAEDSRDIAGLMSTLTEDCVYELVQTGHRWEGHDGATAFYLELLAAYPDVVFELTDIVIGPQGVFETADVHGTHEGTWLGVEATGRHLRWSVAILFPWDPERRLFSGEKIWYTGEDLEAIGILGGGS
jgi:predicted ester cyclase